jgi:hypothetical protein
MRRWIVADRGARANRMGLSAEPETLLPTPAGGRTMVGVRPDQGERIERRGAGERLEAREELRRVTDARPPALDATGPWRWRQQRVAHARERTPIDRCRERHEADGMLRRSLITLAALAAAGVVSAAPAGAQTPTDKPTPGAKPGACVDVASPTSGFSRRAARRAAHRRVLRGSARDIGCGVDRVLISVVRNRHGRCRVLTAKRRLSHRTSCNRRRWLPVRGTARWSFRIPRRLPNGVYVIRTRAIDFAGNAEHPRRHLLRLR